ncbi:MAG: tetratricopeptide repeat protein, partial [Gallionellaceae bacterium]|nr:tetratricopeptide repeat protein [Gallionellaceae bacterium]
MSVINQVLSDLEKRGVNALPGKQSIRAVPAQKDWRWPLLAAVSVLALALALVLAMMLWQSKTRQENPSQVAEAVQPAPMPGAMQESGNVGNIPKAAPVKPGSAAPPAAAAKPEASPAATTEAAPPVVAAQPAMTPYRKISRSIQIAPVPQAAGLSAETQAASPAETTPAPAPSAMTSSAEASPPAATRAPTPPASESKPVKHFTVRQQADNEFRKANDLLQQGHTSGALAGYETALRLDPAHDAARQTAAVLLLKNKRGAEAEHMLQEGLAHNPAHTGFAMLLARLQVERDAVQAGLDTLLKALPHARQQPDYHAFVAALLQRLSRHQESIAHYRTALQQAPDSGVWLMGLGISLQALHHKEEAREAFRRALESRTLNAELQAFVRQ